MYTSFALFANFIHCFLFSLLFLFFSINLFRAPIYLIYSLDLICFHKNRNIFMHIFLRRGKCYNFLC